MKKVVSLLLASALVLSCAGCGSSRLEIDLPQNMNELSAPPSPEFFEEQAQEALLQKEEAAREEQLAAELEAMKEKMLSMSIPADETSAKSVVRAAYNNVKNCPMVHIVTTRTWHDMNKSTATKGIFPALQFLSMNSRWDLWRNNATDEYIYISEGTSNLNELEKCEKEYVAKQDVVYKNKTYGFKSFFDYSQKQGDNDVNVYSHHASAGYYCQDWRQWEVIPWFESEFEMELSEDSTEFIVKVRDFEWPDRLYAFGKFHIVMTIDRFTYTFKEIRVEGEGWTEIATFESMLQQDPEFWRSLYPEEFWTIKVDGAVYGDEPTREERENWMAEYDDALLEKNKFATWTFIE